MDITKYTALEVGKMIKEKKITVRNAVLSLCEKIEKIDGSINAYTKVEKEKALARADEVQSKIDCGELNGALAGVPIAIKDNICTKGIRTTCASKILGDFMPPYNATAVEKLEAEGMIVIGKTNMDEFAMGSTSETSYFGAVKNPWDTNKVPGGSSGGSAAAVAAGEAVCALGSDTGGSIRQPASYCGVTGFKPTYGTVSRYGLIAYASSLDQIGPIAKDVSDCAALLDVIAGHDAHDATSADRMYESFLLSLDGEVKGKKIGVPRQWFEKGLDKEVKDGVLSVADKLKELGAEIVDVDLDFIDYVIPTYYIIATAEASSNLSRFDGVKYGYRAEDVTSVDDLFSKTRSEGFGKEVQKRILLGTFVLSSGYYDAYYRKALKMKRMIVEGFEKAYKQCDVLLCPAAPSTAPVIGESLKDSMKMYLSDIYTVSVNLAGLPGLTVPCGFDKDGMPIGAQLIGPQFSDATVLNIGYAYQKVTDNHKKEA